MVPLQLLVASALAWAGESNGVVLEFTAESRCPPCQAMSPIVSKLQRQGYPIEKIDVDRDKERPAQYAIKAYPTFVLVVDGREVKRIVGQMPEERLKALCDQIPKPENDRAPKQRAVVASNEGGVDLGQASSLPKAAPSQAKAEKPGALARFFGKKETPPAAPSEARAQGEDAAAVAASTQPATPLAATVRLRVKDRSGDNVGTGTIIDSRPGLTLILTCGHIFREWKPGSRVYVDLFHGEKSTEFVGKLVKYELDDKKGLDTGLVSISTDQPLPACRVAPSGTGILAGASVASVGCGGGERPTVQHQKITAINRHMTNDIECSALPEGGRSGGGLFDRNGRVIGICMCADPKYREGIYAGLKAVHAFLDRQGLTHVYRGESATEPEPQIAAVTDDEAEAATPDLGESVEARPGRRAKQPVDVAVSEANRSQSLRPSVSQEDVVGSEVVIIIRSNGQPAAPSRVVRLHRASRGFWENLLPELDPREDLMETTLKRTAREPAERPARRQARRPATNDPQLTASRSDTFEAEADEPKAFRRQRSARREDLVDATR